MSIKDSADKVLMNLTALEYGFRLLEEDEDFKALLAASPTLRAMVTASQQFRVAIGGEVTGMSSMANATREEITRFVETQMGDRVRHEALGTDEFLEPGEVV